MFFCVVVVGVGRGEDPGDPKISPSLGGSLNFGAKEGGRVYGPCWAAPRNMAGTISRTKWTKTRRIFSRAVGRAYVNQLSLMRSNRASFSGGGGGPLHLVGPKRSLP